MTTRRLAAILLATALLVGLLPAIGTAGPAELQLLAPEGQTAVKGGDTVRVNGTADADADVQDEKIIAVDASGATLATLDVAGLVSNDAGVLSASFILGCGFIPGCPDDPALRQSVDGYRIEARVVSSESDLQVVSPVIEFDEIDPNILQYSLIRDADGGETNLVEVRFDEDVADPQGDNPGDWTVGGTPVRSVSGEGDRRVLTTALPFGPDATPEVRYRAQTGVAPVRDNQPYLDEAGNDLTARRRFSLAADRIAPEPPTIDAIAGGTTSRDGDDQAVPVLGSDTTPTVVIGSMEDGHTARLFLDDGDGTLEDDRDTFVGEAIASGGVAEVQWPDGLALPDATHRLFARALDAALCDPNSSSGQLCPNASARSKDALYDLDTTAPTLVDPALASTSAITAVLSENVTGPTEPGDWTIFNPDGTPGPAVTEVSGSGDARVLRAASVLPNSTLRYQPAGARFADEHGNELQDVTIGIVAAPIPVARLVDAAPVDELDGEQPPTIPPAPPYEENEAAFRIELSDPVRAGETASLTLETVGIDATVGSDLEDRGQFVVEIAEGQTGADVLIELRGDELDEVDETFELRVVSTNEFVAVADDTAVGTITDDDPLVELSIGDVTVTEGAVAEVTASLDTASGKDVVADWTLQPGTASSDDDYEAASGTLTIPAGDTSVTVPVTTLDDDLDEPDTETLSLVVEQATAATVADGEGVVSIDDDDPLPTIRVADLTTFEGDDTRLVQLVFTLSEVSGRDVEVDYATSNGAAEAGSDYTAASGTATIPAGASGTTIDLEILGDTTPEPDEDLTVTLSDPSNATVQDTTATVVLINDDGDLPVVTLDLTPGTADEGDPGPFSLLFPEQVVWTLTLSAPLDAPLEVAYRTTEDGTATPGDDFTPEDSTVTIPAETTSFEIPPIDIVSDELYEGDETITLEIDDPLRVELANGEATLAADGVIDDDDDAPTIAFAEGSEAQVVEEGQSATFTVELNEVSGLPASVDWALDFDGAATTADLPDQSGTVTVPADETTATFTVTTIDDGDEEPDETVTVRLSDPVDATLADTADRPTTSQLTLADNEVVVPTITVTGTTVDESDGIPPLTGPELVWRFELDRATSVDVTADWRTTSEGTATPGVDFTGASGTVTIEAGTTTATTDPIAVVDDDLDEFTEQVALVVDDPQNARLEGGVSELASFGSITDDDEPVTVSIGDDATVTEGDLATFEVTLDAESGKTVIVSYTTVDGDAEAGQDYAATSGQLEFEPGTTSRTITVVTTDDSVAEPGGPETLQVELTVETTDAATLGDGSATLTIEDDDVVVDPTRPPVVSLSGNAVDEGDPPPLPLPSTTPMTFQVRLSETPDSEVTVSYTTRAGTAAGDEDFTAVTDSVTIGTESDSAEITIDVLPDTVHESDEDFQLVITDVTGDARLPDGADEIARTGRIRNDDAPPVLGFTDATVDVGVDEGDTVRLTVELIGETELPASADWAVSFDGGATAADLPAQSGTVEFPVGTTSASFDVTTTQDEVDESGEAFSVVLSGPSGASLDPDADVATVTINDDELPELEVAASSVDEGDAAGAFQGAFFGAPGVPGTTGEPLVFTLTLSRPAEADVNVDWATTDSGTAVAGSDYVAASGTATIEAGQTGTNVEVDVLDDDLDEFDELVVVRFSNLRGAKFPEGIGSRLDVGGLIDDNDPLVTASLGDSVEVAEGDPATFDVTLNRDSGKDVELRLTTADGSATSGQDYRATTRTLTIPAGETAATFTVPTFDDSVVESTEDATVRLEVVDSDTAELGTSTATLTITDDDVVPTDPDAVVVSLSGAAVEEGDPFALPLPVPTGGATLDFVVRLSEPADGDVTLDFETRAATATAGEDFTATSGQVTIADGQSEATIQVPVLADTIDEFDEDLTLALTAVSGDAVLPGGELERTGRILDDDAASQLRVNDATVLEGSAAELDVTLDGESGKDITVEYAFVDGTATAGADYVAASGTLEFPAGTTSRTVSVATLADTDTGELIEQFELVLSAPTNAALDDPRGTVSIVDLDLDGLPTVTAVFLEDTTTVEADGDRTALVPVRLSAESDEDVAVTWSTQQLTATDGEDYRADGGQVVIPAGATSAQIPVTIIGDDEVESDEDFLVLLTAAEGAVITGPTGRVTIEDDDTEDDGTDPGGDGDGDGAPDPDGDGDEDGAAGDEDLAATGGGGALLGLLGLALGGLLRRRRDED